MDYFENPIPMDYVVEAPVGMESYFMIAGLHNLGAWAKQDLEIGEKAFKTAGRVVYKGIVYLTHQAYEAGLWCHHDDQCHQAALKVE